MRRGQAQRVDEIVGALQEGCRYLVPTVKGAWLEMHGVADWPVFGPRHKDPDLGVNFPHYHIDHRFVPEAEFKRDTNTVVTESCDAPVRYQLWTCLQACVILSNVKTPKGTVDLNRDYAGKQCEGSRKAGWVCPHKGAWLGSQPAVGGVITCQGHGLRINSFTGKVCKIKGPSRWWRRSGAALAVVLSAAPYPAMAQATSCGALGYTASGGSTVILGKGGGVFDILVWAEDEKDTTIKLPGSAKISVFDPMQGTGVTQTLTGSSVTVSGGGLKVVEVSGASGSGGSPAASAGAFVDSIGVNQHLNWSGTVYADQAKELRELQYLGISNVRDAAPYRGIEDQHIALAKAGVKFDFVTGPANADVSQTFPSDMSVIETIARAVPGSVRYVEAPNELNGQTVTMNGSSSANPGIAAAIVRQEAAAVRGNATLMSQGTKMVNLSVTNGIGGWSEFVDGLGDLSSHVDMANWHTYFGSEAPAKNVASMYGDAQRAAPGKSVLFTEIGYTTAQNAGGFGVDPGTQAKYTLYALADAFAAGVERSYLYELMDGAANPAASDIENNWGLFLADGTPKPVATALHNLTGILGAGGAGQCVGQLVVAGASLPGSGFIPVLPPQGAVGAAPAGPVATSTPAGPQGLPAPFGEPLPPATACNGPVQIERNTVPRNCAAWASAMPSSYEDAENKMEALLAKERGGIAAAKARLGGGHDD